MQSGSHLVSMMGQHCGLPDSARIVCFSLFLRQTKKNMIFVVWLYNCTEGRLVRLRARSPSLFALRRRRSQCTRIRCLQSRQAAHPPFPFPVRIARLVPIETHTDILEMSLLCLI